MTHADDTATDETVDTGDGLVRQFARMVEVGHQIDAFVRRGILPQCLLKLRVSQKPPRIERRHLGSDANDLDVGNGAKRIENRHETARAHQQWITTGQEDSWTCG